MSGKVGVASLVALGLIGTTGASYAEDLNLDEVVVSAGLNPVDEEKVGRAYTVITAKELEQHQVQTVADALRMVPGIAVNGSGSAGGVTSVFIRGGESRHVLVLVDGVEASSMAVGAYDFSSLETSGIERIEVLRGPQSSLYGARAMSGVINIITKRGARDGKQHYSLQTEVGTDKSALVNAGVSGGKDRFDYAFSGAFHYTDGINTAMNGSEEDSNRNVTLNGKVNADLTDNLSADLSFRYSDKDADTDEYTTTLLDNPFLYLKTRELYANFGLTNSLWDDRFVQKARVKYSRTHNRGLDRAVTNWVTMDKEYQDYGDDSSRLSLNYQGTVFFDTPSFANAKHNVTGAVEWLHETYDEAYSTDPTRNRNSSGYAMEYNGEFWDSLFLGAGIRYDHFEDFDDAVTYKANVAYVIDNLGVRVHSSVGTGTNIPTYYQTFNALYGNADLKPETNIGWDFGIEKTMFDNRFKLDVTYFNERLKDEISTDAVTWVYTNITGISHRQGIEVSAGADITDSLHVDASYTYTDSKTPDGVQETRRPKNSGTVKITKAFLDGKAHAFVDASFSADRTDFTGPLGDYTLVNVGADYKITDNVQIYGRVNNLFDEDYQEIAYYNTAGITGYLGLKANF
nr:TonB-dependent receptor [uncultured Cohaesibacter sp.]